MASFRWRRLDLPGTDHATLTATERGNVLRGHAQFREAGARVDVRYCVQISPGWYTESARLEGIGPFGPLVFDIVVLPGQRWELNGTPVPSVNGCIDVDLNLTPATNLLSLRGLALAPGASAEVVAAWLEFPEPRLKPLHQQYRHLGNGRYDYRCSALPFESVLESNADGFVTTYPPLWEPETTG